jgi:hypothetical protein
MEAVNPAGTGSCVELSIDQYTIRLDGLQVQFNLKLFVYIKKVRLGNASVI